MLRTETTTNKTYDFGVGRLLRNLPQLREIGFAAVCDQTRHVLISLALRDSLDPSTLADSSGVSTLICRICHVAARLISVHLRPYGSTSAREAITRHSLS